jgi:branched-chain amino acid transport system permease protein
MLTLPVLFQVIFNGLSLSAIYVLMALGFTLIFGIMRIINFAHGAFAMLGGFAMLYLYGEAGLPFLLALPLSAATVAALSLILERYVYRRFYLQEMQAMIATLGISMALTYGSVIVFDSHERSIPPAFTEIYTFGSVVVTQDRIVVFAVTMVTLVLFYLLMRFTRIGLAMRVVAEDLEIAEAQGINTQATYRVSFFVATAMAALAGALLGQLYSVSPFSGDAQLVKAFTVVILGGLGNIPGAAVGGLLLGMGESFASTFYGAAIAQFMSFGLIILVLLFRPQGILGGRMG